MERKEDERKKREKKAEEDKKRMRERIVGVKTTLTCSRRCRRLNHHHHYHREEREREREGESFFLSFFRDEHVSFTFSPLLSDEASVFVLLLLPRQKVEK